MSIFDCSFHLIPLEWQWINNINLQLFLQLLQQFLNIYNSLQLQKDLIRYQLCGLQIQKINISNSKEFNLINMIKSYALYLYMVNLIFQSLF
ncbi:unnamed protein product [Paramecium pentaurelia]|uniref:Uncharacterized protein n=1 Tax=Paramecium pentaurelia TaxID=43138 RepID=A0A8S1XDC6_9CILI|nr:unnamed protein product [Paramecium pentaurelia]